jgi:hypothetical protein
MEDEEEEDAIGGGKAKQVQEKPKKHESGSVDHKKQTHFEKDKEKKVLKNVSPSKETTTLPALGNNRSVA